MDFLMIKLILNVQDTEVNSKNENVIFVLNELLMKLKINFILFVNVQSLQMKGINHNEIQSS